MAQRDDSIDTTRHERHGVATIDDPPNPILGPDEQQGDQVRSSGDTPGSATEPHAPEPSLDPSLEQPAGAAGHEDLAASTADAPALDAPPSEQPVVVTSDPLPSSRVRARLARLGRAPAANPVLEPLFSVVRHTHPKADLALLERAYRTAEQAHRGQLRKSGDPYITHPLAVATILAELGMTPPTLCAALLHDTVEDTACTLAQITEDFGSEIASLVDGVTKLDKVTYGDSAQSATIRKMIVAMSKDIRVLVIKLADRLHNMRTLRYLKTATQRRKATETLDIYAPLAHRLGMNTIKWELEDLAFATLQPKIYDEIVRLVAEQAPARGQYLSGVIDQVLADLREAKLRTTVNGRPKHYYSIYQKMVNQASEFNEIYDLVGIRILTESERDCYAVLGTIHSRWKPIPGRFKDYIATPKFNLYQSLHTTVIGPGGKPVELQIRSYEMHNKAEYGVAAHWKYKDRGRGERPDESPTDIGWVRQLADWQAETGDPAEFLESLRFEINTLEVYVFTPKGQVIVLPAGSTPVDFAYHVHTEVGHRTVGARVNNRLVALESPLSNGDVVEIFTTKAANAGPSRDWLGFVKSPRARTKIRQHLTRERRDENIDRGKDQIAKLIRKSALPLRRLMTHESMTVVARDLHYADVSSLYAAVGEGNLTPDAVVRRLSSDFGSSTGLPDEDTSEERDPRAHRRRTHSTSGVSVHGMEDIWVKLAKCCTPVPGDDVIGFVTRGSGVSVHRSTCTNAEALKRSGDRIVEVDWNIAGGRVFLVNMQVEALDRSGLLSDISRALSDQHVDITAMSLTTSRDRTARIRFTIEMADMTHLGHVQAAVRHVGGVYDVQRVTAG